MSSNKSVKLSKLIKINNELNNLNLENQLSFIQENVELFRLHLGKDFLRLNIFDGLLNKLVNNENRNAIDTLNNIHKILTNNWKGR